MFTTQTHVLKNGRSDLHYSIIPWDSEYLHNTTIEIENFTTTSISAFKKLIIQLQKTHKLKKGDLLVCKIPLNEYSKTYILAQNEFYFLEESITITIDLSSWKPQDFSFQDSEKYKLISAKTTDIKGIQKIAQKTFTADRFHLDTRIPKIRADYRFKMWIKNSFRSLDSIYKLVDENNDIIGFFIIREHTEYVELRLAGLDPKCIGHGLGKMLYHHMHQLLKERGHVTVKAIISLNNLPVLNVYTYLAHAKFVDPLFVFHKLI